MYIIGILINYFLMNACSSSSNPAVIDENPIVKMRVSYVTKGEEEENRKTVDIFLELYPKESPITVENFIGLINAKKYDNTIFHRIIPEFMIQGGDFDNLDGRGGHAYRCFDYCSGNPNPNSGCSGCAEGTWTIPDEVDNELSHIPGAISMTKTNVQNSGGSQFFIIPEDSTQTHLDGNHTVFGKITTGLSSITEISEVKTDTRDKPIYDVILISVIIN